MSETDRQLLNRIPPQRELLRPALLALSDGKRKETKEIQELVRRGLKLPERVMTLSDPDYKHANPVFTNRVNFALNELKERRLEDCQLHGYRCLTKKGRRLSENLPESLDRAYLKKYFPTKGEDPNRKEKDEPFGVEAYRYLNIILYGPPGTGKTFETFNRCVEICNGDKKRGDTKSRYKKLRKEGRIEFVTFHQSYGYEEFVEGLRPEQSDGGAGFKLVVEDGILKRIAEKARKSKELAYVLVIDEINRANVSKVFGELVTLLEEDKREDADNEISVTLPHSREKFTLPKNLYILGTMNTADRSIALLDTALRRRFEFEEIPPKPREHLKTVDGIDLPAALEAINERLEWLLDRDHLIGHAWFMGAESMADVNKIMRNKIVPLIAEYFHDDWAKVSYVLGGHGVFVKRKKLAAPPGLEDDEKRYSWTISESEELEEKSYERLISGGRKEPESSGED